MTGHCAYLGCGAPTGLTREGLCATHRSLVDGAHTHLDAEPAEVDQ